jgi:hypothetical protein
MSKPTLGERIRRLQREQKIGDAALGVKAGYKDGTTLKEFDNPNFEPGLFKGIRLAYALGVTLEELIAGTTIADVLGKAIDALGGGKGLHRKVVPVEERSIREALREVHTGSATVHSTDNVRPRKRREVQANALEPTHVRGRAGR